VNLSSHDPTHAVAERLRWQSGMCGSLGSPLYAELLGRMAADVEQGGPSWRVLEAFSDWPSESLYSLRVMGAIQRLALTGHAPELAPLLRAGGDPAVAWPPLIDLLERSGERVRELALAHSVQTNEVGRSAALAPAMLWISKGRPLRLLELGASAGLNLRWDAYGYEDLWGDPASPVKLERRYEGTRPPFDPPAVEIVERRGCDATPIDPASEDGRITLLSFVWPDQTARVELLREALELAPRVPATVEPAGAGEWIERALAEPPKPGVVTVVFHSIFWLYLDEPERERVRGAIEEAGDRASSEAPLAWLRLEPDTELARMDVTLWPGGESRLLARSGYHGAPVRWLV
jgi:hypothetical protein